MDLSQAARQAMARLAADLTRVFGDRFVALVAYGPTRTAAFASAIDRLCERAVLAPAHSKCSRFVHVIAVINIAAMLANNLLPLVV